jgi:hypothetical protein
MAQLAIVLAVFMSLLQPSVSMGQPAAAQCVLAPGTVVELVGTPHLFIADDQGVLHWGGDTRALAGRTIDWNRRCALDLPTLQAAGRGDPWLSAGLPKVGDPIYQAKWEDGDAAPTLLHIQSIADVELFGITQANYTTFVVDRAAWEQRYGFQMGGLRVGPLASAASLAWSPSDQESYAQLLRALTGAETTALSQATRVGIDAGAALPPVATCEAQGLVQFERTRNQIDSLSTTRDCIDHWRATAIAAPAAPTNLRAATGAGGLRLEWRDLSTSEEGFRIQRNDQTVLTVAENVTVYADPAWTASVGGCYRVVAFNIGGQAASERVCPGAPVGAPTAPTEVRGAGTLTFGGLRVDWLDTANNEDGSRVLRNDQVIGTVGPNVATFNDYTWDVSQRVCYRVVAFNAVGETPSDRICPSGIPPITPTGLRLTPLAGGIGLRLEWVDTSAAEDGFRIMRGDQAIAAVGMDVTTFVDALWRPDIQDCYRVVAFNAAGQSASRQACPGS